MVLVSSSSVASLALAAPSAPVSGTVKDASGARVAGGRVSLLDAHQVPVATARTDESGAFALKAPAPGSYLLLAEAPGLAPRRLALMVEAAGLSGLAVLLQPTPLEEQVTVTAHPGRAEAVGAVAQPVNLIESETLGLRSKSVVAQMVNEEVGVHLQRTSPTMAGVFVRGLTGAKVNVFVDGQRYSTAAARGGVNTFLDLVDPGLLEAAEVLRGPSSAQYGSDALGGSVQFLTRSPSFAASGREVGGSYAVDAGSADARFGGSLSGSYATPRFALLGTAAGRRANTLRAGKGTDSHNAMVRFLGVDPEPQLDGGRLPDTAFTQYAGMLKAQWAPSERSRLVASYTRSQQDGGKRYDQLLGGDGNLIADLRNLMLDRASLQYERSAVGFFDSLRLGYSLNSQREERVNQGGNGNPRAAVNHEYERTTVHGTQAALSKAWSRHALVLGGDAYHERLTAPSFSFNPVTGATSVRRGRIPDGARYTSAGVYLQESFEAVPGRLRLAGNLRWSHASYRSEAADSPLVNGQPLWPDDERDASSLTFRTGAVLTLGEGVSLAANVARGFRAPHVTDLGTLGLTGSGFEVSAAALAGREAFVGTTAGADAVSSGLRAAVLEPERSLSYEGSLRVRRSVFDAELTVFANDISGNIQKQALILPQGAVGTRLGDQEIVRQSAGGAVFVAAASNPVLVGANFDDARVWGLEHTLEVRAGGGLTASAVFTYLHAEDQRTHRPPNIEGGTPAPDGWLKVRWAPAGKRFWIEPYLHGALRQENLS
ncbi:MAG TPA: TonB-dependent receptor, partial [Vicinamibacteria bacterium]